MASTRSGRNDILMCMLTCASVCIQNKEPAEFILTHRPEMSQETSCRYRVFPKVWSTVVFIRLTA